MATTENPIDAGFLENIKGSASEGAELVGVKMNDPPKAIVEAVNDYVSNLPNESSDGESDYWTDHALPVGSLWGEQLVREYGWEWAKVVFHDEGDSKAIGVFSRDRSLAIYPWHFVLGCLENRAPATILLAFNMLAADKIPPQPEKGYVNVMDGVHHIVPPS